MAKVHVTSKVTPGWSVVGIVAEGGSIDLRGLNPWDIDWEPTGQTIAVAHPTYPQQRHSAKVCCTRDASGRDVVFAVSEVSNGAYAFFLQEASAIAN